jgi:hypothetical protein
MVCFRTKNPNLGKFWWFWQKKILVYFISTWSILQPWEIFYGLLIYFVVIWHIFPRFGMLYQGKSGNPAGISRLLEVCDRDILNEPISLWPCPRAGRREDQSDPIG